MAEDYPSYLVSPLGTSPEALADAIANPNAGVIGVFGNDTPPHPLRDEMGPYQWRQTIDGERFSDAEPEAPTR